MLRAQIATNNTAHWMERLEARDLLCAQVQKLGDALDDRQTEVNNMLIRANDGAQEFGMVGTPVHLSDDGFVLRHLPPHLGADGSEVLSEAGYDAATIAQLRADKIVA